MYRKLSTLSLAKEIERTADAYGGNAINQSILNHFKRMAYQLVELEKKNIKMAYEHGIENAILLHTKDQRTPDEYIEWQYGETE
jgi:hypothetical protein